ncbi:MAG TPA: hypothetical protein VL155_20030 [Terriglobales bacterium]|nr:hypothetical protein [Terriglobales bacterium]
MARPTRNWLKSRLSSPLGFGRAPDGGSIDLWRERAQELSPVPGKFKVVLALLLATIVAVVLVSPAVNMEPTAVHAWSTARNLVAPACTAISTALISLLPDTRVLFLPIAASTSPGAADLVALNCTRLC